MKKLTTREFIEKAKKVHGDRYGYSRVVYKNAHTKVVVICPDHGGFWQRPDAHLSGRGCPVCSGTKKLTTREFIEKAKKVHGDKYDYSKAVYKNAHTKVCIICRKHNSEFWQTPDGHMSGQGCPKCGSESAGRVLSKRMRKGTLLKNGVKKCSKCQQYKPSGGFASNSRTKDGLRPWCKSCVSRRQNGPASFNVYAHQLSYAEEVRNSNGILETKCTKCGKFFKPSVSDVGSRIKALNGKMEGESRLYCSDECKNSCSIFYQHLYPKGLNPNIDRPYQNEWSKMVIELANNECEICGSKNDLQAHHIQPVKTHPHLSADIDNGVCLCTQCHNRAHSDECSTGKLAALVC